MEMISPFDHFTRSASALACHGLTDVQNIFPNHRDLDPKNFMTIAGNDLRQRFKVADFVRADERCDVFVQAVKLQKFFIWYICDGNGTSSDRVPRLWAQRRDLNFVNLICEFGYLRVINRFKNHVPSSVLPIISSMAFCKIACPFLRLDNSLPDGVSHQL